MTAPRPRRRGLHKIFTTFPGGWPAFGLLLLRFAVAFRGFQYAIGAVAQSNPPSAISWIMAASASLVGTALVLGILTPLASCASTLINVRDAVWMLLFHQDGAAVSSVEPGYAAVISIALILLGPGAISIDARLFGRREIIIPDDPPRSFF